MKIFLTLLLAIITIVVISAASVTLKVSPVFQFAPGYVRLTLTIEPDPNNRAYCLSYEGSNSGQTCRDLNGDKASRTRQVELKDLPAGDYVAVLSVVKSDSSVVRSGEVTWRVLESLP